MSTAGKPRRMLILLLEQGWAGGSRYSGKGPRMDPGRGKERETEACPADFEQSSLPSCGLNTAVVLRGKPACECVITRLCRNVYTQRDWINFVQAAFLLTLPSSGMHD